MELDDFKQSWNNQTKKDLKPLNDNFMELIQNKNYGPLADFKKRFLQILGLSLIIVFILVDDFNKSSAPQAFSFLWFYIPIVIWAISFNLYNYFLVSKMQNTQSFIKPAIEKDIKRIENGNKYQTIFMYVIFTTSMVVFEVLSNAHKLVGFENWFSQPFALRILIYLGLIVLSYFFRKFIYKRYTGRHIAYLKEILRQTE